MTTDLETIRQRWAGVAWRYEETRDDYYVGEALLIHGNIALLELDEPSEEEQALLKLCAEAPGDVGSLLAVIGILQAQLGAWEAACALQVAVLQDVQSYLHGALYNVDTLKRRIKEATETNAGQLLLTRLQVADELADAIEQFHEMSRAVEIDSARKADLGRAAYRLGQALASYRGAQKASV